jgi:2,3-bisphosphoglycerate-dependent phosphoglycerate mutase
MIGEATRVIAVRHGETDWNATARMQGQIDIPLNERGRDQARRVGIALREEPLAAVYSSDLSRAEQTAAAIAAEVGVTVQRDEGLRERGFGIFEGLTVDEVRMRWPLDCERWQRRDARFGPEGGEVLADFHARCVDTALRLCAAHPGQAIALVAHGGVLDCLYRAALRIPLDSPRTWRIGNATINRLLCTPGGLTVVGWSDDLHLEDAPIDEQ